MTLDCSGSKIWDEISYTHCNDLLELKRVLHVRDEPGPRSENFMTTTELALS